MFFTNVSQKKHFSRVTELYIVLVMVFFVGLIWIFTRMTMRRQQKIFGDGSIRLEDDDTTYFEDEVKLSQITFDDVSYNVSKLRALYVLLCGILACDGGVHSICYRWKEDFNFGYWIFGAW